MPILALVDSPLADANAVGAAPGGSTAASACTAPANSIASSAWLVPRSSN
ncbi:hypothetical protein NF700_12795 [Sphingomonadaceae bacterium OTU29MARTA1]|nr:hypothetical protein NF700_12795 [Sphingomonadaceae bacterium OTU29MARTA1]